MTLHSAARRVARLLEATDVKIVFAESCTGGLVSGALTAIPGISNYHCGGVVAYRNETKSAYLKIPRKLLATVGPVSSEVAALMAKRVLELTPEAHISASVTGHLGPNAPPDLDGLVFVGIARTALPGTLRGRRRSKPLVHTHELHCRPRDKRMARQRWVVERVLELVATELESARPSGDAD